MRTFARPLLALLLAACASSPSGLAAIPRLEQQRERAPSNAAVQRALGIAYYQAERYPEARAALETAARLEPKDGTTALYLGLTAEAQNDLSTARRAYSSYLQYGRTSRVRSQLQARLAGLARRELAQEAKAAVAQEAALSREPGSPRTIAVMPLRFSGKDTTLQPLERGFADLLTTDLARSSQLTLVERSRLQALLDEMKLQSTGATDASTSARAGRLLRAGRVVQGALLQLPSGDASVVRVDAAVVDATTSQVQGGTQAVDVLDAIFTLEKRLALDLFAQLGVTLTPAERNAIEERPTRSLSAFLAYSRGLGAADEGRYDDASRFFNDAVRIDPGFTAAQQKGQQAQAAQVGAAMTTATVEASIKGSAEEKVVTAATQGQASTSGTTSGGSLSSAAQATAEGLNTSTAGTATAGASTTTTPPPPPTKDPVSSGTNSENTTSSGVVRFVLPRRP